MAWAHPRRVFCISLALPGARSRQLWVFGPTKPGPGRIAAAMDDLDLDEIDAPPQAKSSSKRRPAAAHARPTRRRAVRDHGDARPEGTGVARPVVGEPAAHARSERCAVRDCDGTSAGDKRHAPNQSGGPSAKKRRASRARSIASFAELAAEDDEGVAPRPPNWPQEWKPPLTVGSDCAGLVTEGLALDILGIEHKHLFVTEENKDVRHLAYQVLAEQTPAYYKDVLRRDVTELPRVDLYVFGFPCQPFSPAGQRKGMQDPRAQVLFHCLDYVKHHRPPIVVMENSHRLACTTCSAQTVRGGLPPNSSQPLRNTSEGGIVKCSGRLRFTEALEGILNLLAKWGYETRWKILNTKEHGALPQSRPRVYLVALRVHTSSAHPPRFTWPRPISNIPLSELLDLSGGAAPAVPRCLNGRALGVLAKGRERMVHADIDPDRELCVIDLGSSAGWSSSMHECSPCLTASRCSSGGFYMTKVDRMMTVTEMCRLQGIPDGRFDFEWAGVAQHKFLHAVGNAMTSTVLARVLAHALFAAQLTKKTAPTIQDVRDLLRPGVRRQAPRSS